MTGEVIQSLVSKGSSGARETGELYDSFNKLLSTREVTQSVVCEGLFGLSTPCGRKQSEIEKTQKHESDIKCMIQHIHLYFFHPFLIPKQRQR